MLTCPLQFTKAAKASTSMDLLSEASTSFGIASLEPKGHQFVGTTPIQSTSKKARIRIPKLRAPRTKQKLQHYCSIVMRLHRVISRIKRPVNRTLPHAELIAEAGNHLSKDFLELLKVQVPLNPSENMGAIGPCYLVSLH
ncbi:uncharacterized protein LOC142775820 [Rhipicephalus microplus]|uniref:uncharacterized protein LOC142775820 n=1 Tax=Rhipicephalus microplus TaxID=6941 RepID=UPI003F6B9CFC